MKSAPRGVGSTTRSLNQQQLLTADWPAAIIAAPVGLHVETNMTPSHSPWLSAKEAAEHLGVSTRTLYEFCRTEGLRHARLTKSPNGVMRFKREWLDEWLEARAECHEKSRWWFEQNVPRLVPVLDTAMKQFTALTFDLIDGKLTYRGYADARAALNLRVNNAARAVMEN